ncbi:MAG: cupin domain-containing protein [Pseudomonadota bacterium]
MPLPGFHPTAIDPQLLQPAPIHPDWIIEGQPQARAVELVRSPDGTCTSAQWDCTAGTFYWYFWNEETIHILEGSVTVRDCSGREFTLKTGDVANLPANKWMVWHVDSYVRKLAHCRYPVPRPFGVLVRTWQRMRTRIGLQRSRPLHPALRAM